MVRFLKILLKTVELGFIVFCIFLASLVFRDQSLPPAWVEAAVARLLPAEAGLKVRLDAFSFGFRHGVEIRGLRVFETLRLSPAEPMASVDRLVVDVFGRAVRLEGARYPRLPDSYYAPENNERNARVEATLPEIPRFSLTLVRPEILGAAPEEVVADVEVHAQRLSATRIHLDWPAEPGVEPMFLDGFCSVDLDRQEVRGEVRGSARQAHIRPLLVALDLPVSLPYIDAFTEVPGKVPSVCAWHVNLVNNDFTMELDLDPTLGKYNSVPLKRANGKLNLFVYTRGKSLNYHHVFGPIVAVGPKDEPLAGTVTVDGTNGYNTVTVEAKSALPVADLLKIGGFEDEHVDADVFGDATCALEFRFPRSMTNNYEVLNGKGRLRIRDGQLMRIRGFKGLVSQLAERVPGVSWFTDTTQGSCDYVIENGILTSDNIYIEGSLFSIKMYGRFDTVRDKLDFTVRVQFTKRDSLVGKILHPLTWPFTKLLLEFHLGGSAGKPKWDYISVVDRVVDAAK